VGGASLPITPFAPFSTRHNAATIATTQLTRRMHETFVYSSRSQLLQVTFWHAYRDFFTHPSTVDQLLSASEVIKNVTIAFPGASAKVWTDGTGQQKFVIAGMGFRRGSGASSSICLLVARADGVADDDNAFPCQWQGCLANFSGKSPADLYSHVLGSHIRLEQPPPTCAWASCRLPFDPTRLEDHVATHLPTSPPIPVPDTLTVHPSVPDHLALHGSPLHHPPAPLPRSVKLSFTGQVTPCDSRRQPTGPSFLTALVLRNLSRSLRTEISLAAPVSEDGEAGAGGWNGAEKKKHLLEERYGLPIPDSVLREEEEEERNAEKDEEDLMSPVQRDRAVLAFQQVEDKVLEVMESNMVGLAAYLSSAVGW
jgi:chromatin structure-remodeling complex subunit RSC9